MILGFAWSWGPNATYPLAELLIDDERVLVRLRWGWLRGLSRAIFMGRDVTWEAPRDSVIAEAYGKGAMTRGVLLRSPGLPGMIFWCQRQHAVLEALGVETPRV